MRASLYFSEIKVLTKYLLIAAVIFSYSYAFAEEQQRSYTLNGVVVDKNTREPVPFAVISIWKGNRFTTADSLGRFSLENTPAGVYRIQVDILGYTQYISE